MVNDELPPIPPLSEILDEDDGSRELDSLTPKERRPRFVKNRLLNKTRSFSKEEREVANMILAPSKMLGDWPH
jgi:hypothetical protein